MIDTETAGILVAGAVLLAAGGTQRSRARAHRRRFASFAAFSAAVDGDAIRAVRDREGEIRAVKAVRDAHPGAPLADSVRYVRSLRTR
ncbi:hypothetical protein [Streptomyces sp. RFCAC02]|uniref:hypothetical protein n=1 Tax=Streptomyces sp. RFCAC02 TaxID=2499143 RepID=UPI00101FFF9E|nr:hypothetical protein [Streptomyces sp. RFCAC02]